ncbi:MAG: mandelate racemase/muconate lactonizing enzyme family protein [Planctomycetota bacterium]
MTAITHVDAIPIRIPRDEPYLGKLEDGVTVTETGYFVRPGNRSVYSIHDQSLLVKITTKNGVVGWGECVAFVAPQANAAIIDEVLGPLLIGRDVSDPAVIYHDLYDLMRVRGFFGGYYHDCLAAIDIALWDAFGKAAGQPVCQLLGGCRHATMPAYVSGLPKPTLAERVELAKVWQARGFSAFKFASAVSHEGTADEMAALRAALGPEPDILCDMHWKHTAQAAIKLIDAMDAHNLCVAEAPCRPEDIAGQAQVAAAVRCPLGIGEELRTIHEYVPRFERRAIGVIQPEMGRTGITSFMEICSMAKGFGCTVMPHASIGIGVFQAASLHASAPLPHLVYHEYQHSIFDKNLAYVTGDMACAGGRFTVPTGPGLGVEPRAEVLDELRIGD